MAFMDIDVDDLEVPDGDDQAQESQDLAADDWEKEIEKPKKEQPKEEKPAPQEKKPEPKEQKTQEPKPKPAAKKENQSQSQKKGASGATEPASDEPRLRSPICVIMGHVDTGKTKLLDKIRRTKVQDGEAGGITQQIGATFFPVQTLRDMTKHFAMKYKLEYKLPGFLIIDTPGHESFSNLRSRGSSLCDIAILVVDIMHGIESQTLESINMLRKKRNMFIIALNKIDRISDWKENPNAPFELTWKKQSEHAQYNFKKRLEEVKTQFMEQGLNIAPYFQMKFGPNQKIDAIPVVPTSAITGEGIPDLLMLAQLLTQTRMATKLVSRDELQCTVLEVKVEEGIGVTLDVILVNGELHVGDTFVVAGLNGPIVSHIRALLTPQPLKELRVKGQWVHHDVIYAAMGCKISAPELEGAIAGSELFVAREDDDIEDLKDKCNQDIASVFEQVDKSGEGLFVQASTLGSLEALLSYLKDKNLKVAMMGIGPVHRKDVIAISHMVTKSPKYAVILAFDVPITQEAKQAAAETGVTIFDAQIIYHLTDQYDEFLKRLVQKEKDAARQKIYFPAAIKVLPESIYNRSKPIIMGVKVTEGTLRKGTPLMLNAPKPICIGTVDGIRINDKEVDVAPTNAECSVLVKAPADWTPVAGKDFKAGDEFVTRMNREIIDLIKAHFRDELKKEDWSLIVRIKRILRIQ